jgi:hypothetical protein
VSQRVLVALLVGLLLIIAAGYALRGRDDEDVRASRADASVVAILLVFAREPSDEAWRALPLAGTVELGLGRRLVKRVRASELREPHAWSLDADGFRGRSGTFSALDILAGHRGELERTIGPHRQCVSPPLPAPPSVAELRRVSVQPREVESCLQWWSVDVFVTTDGRIRAVTVDLWEP